MAPNDLILLFKARSVIQREALVSALLEQGVESATSPRHMSNRVADDTLDLSLEGYSVFFDGFPIYVKERHQKEAERLLALFLQRTAEAPGDSPTEETPHLRRFFFCAIFTVILPGIFHAVGLYHLIKALRAVEKIRPLSFLAGLALFILTLIASIIILLHTFK